LHRVVAYATFPSNAADTNAILDSGLDGCPSLLYVSRMPLQIESLDREQLAVLGREWLLHGHLQDRVGMALVLGEHDRDTMEKVAIEEWMAASPIYSRRMQQALGFVGTGVATMMKNLQLDIGAPHQFMDFRYRLDDPEHGEFWLAHCGALMDVEPMGTDFVHGMCHAIEDPTFDATAGATNPLAQIRPIHRPPRIPSNRMPHCAWKIDIVADGPNVSVSALEAVVANSALAQLPIPSYPASVDGGWVDYSGEFDPDFSLEDLSRSALLTALDEFGLQSHLLLRSLLLAVRENCSPELMVSMLPRQIRGWCGLTAQRLRDAFGLQVTVDGVSSLLALHPMMAPVAYTGFSVTEGVVSFDGGVAVRDHDGATWVNMPDRYDDLSAVVQAAFPTAAISAEGVISVGNEPVRVARELGIAQISTGATFRFSQRRPVRV
jgi:hypothetical protein